MGEYRYLKFVMKLIDNKLMIELLIIILILVIIRF